MDGNNVMTSWTSRRVAIAAVVLSLLVVSGNGWAEEPGINLYGFSHHGNKEVFGHLHEFNPGAGVQWTFSRSGRASLEGNAGIYSDSFAHANYHLSLGGRLRVAGPVDLGLQLINSVSASAHDSRPVVTPFPFVAVRSRWATWNVTYTPEIPSISPTGLAATYVTLYPGRWRQGGRPKADEGPGSGFGGLEFSVAGLWKMSGLVNGVDGLGPGYATDGFLWRRMFDDRRGLRLGCLFGAELNWRQYDNYPKSASTGTYDSSMLIQYVQRQAPHGRLRTYWATGLETHYRGGVTEDRINDSWRTDLGLEYALGGNLSLLLETGIGLNYQWLPRGSWDGDTQYEEMWHLGANGGRLALVAWRGGADIATADAQGDRAQDDDAQLDDAQNDGAHHSGPVLLLDANLRAVDDGTIGWQWATSPQRAWRLTVWGEAGHERTPEWGGSGTNTSDYSLQLDAQRLWRRANPRGVSTYWGAGPLVGYGVNYLHGIDYDGEHVDNRRHVFAIGGTLLVGADYPVWQGLSVMAEYGTQVYFATRTYVDMWAHGWAIAPRTLKFGVVCGW